MGYGIFRRRPRIVPKTSQHVHYFSPTKDPGIIHDCKIKHLAVQIDITDNTTDTDPIEGLFAGFFRWVTGRPNYGGTVTPTGDNDGDNWKEGILLNENAFGTPDRMIDINLGGEYGSLSGFTFTRENSNKFQDYLTTNSYFLINAPIQFHVVLDDVFVQTWSGKVTETIFNETTFRIVCEDVFESAHKVMPPNAVSQDAFPEASSRSIGKSIPRVFGDVLRSPLVNVSGKSEPEILGYSDIDREEIVVSGAITIGTVNLDQFIRLKTPNQPFGANHFRDTGQYWLRVVKGIEQILLISRNSESINSGSDITTDIILTKPLDGVTPGDFQADNIYPAAGVISDDVWFFEIIKMDLNYISSEDAVNDFGKIGTGRGLSTFDKDRDDYILIPELVESVDITTSNNLKHPTVNLLNNELDIEGDFNRLIPIIPTKIIHASSIITDENGLSTPSNEFNTTDFTEFLDKDRSSGLETSWNTVDLIGTIFLEFEVFFPKSIVLAGFNELFLCFDSEIINQTSIGNDSLAIKITAVSIFGDKFSTISNLSYPGGIPESLTTQFNFLPNEYYRDNGDDDGEDSNFGLTISGTNIKDLVKIPEALLDSFNKNIPIAKFLIEISLTQIGAEKFTINQIGFFAKQNLNVVQDTIYMKTSGELVSGNETNNVFRTFQHILETNDGLGSINFGNLDLNRSGWPVGRTVTNRQISSKYLKELCQQSFVALFPDRFGNRSLSAFREKITKVFTHSDINDEIIEDSISVLKSTDITDVYNEFELFYDFNPATKNYNRTIFITKIGAGAVFPDIGDSTGTNITRTITSVTILNQTIGGLSVAKLLFAADPTWATIGNRVSFSTTGTANFSFGTLYSKPNSTTLIVTFNNTLAAIIGTGPVSGTLTDHSELVKDWTTFAGGFTDYVNAKESWDVCQDSFSKTKTANKFPEQLSRLDWYHDPGAFIGVAPDMQSAAHKYLDLLLPYVTRLKDIAHYSIPMSQVNLKRELMDFGTFADTIYTNGVARDGYITRILVDAGADKIDLEVLLLPADIKIIPDNDIIQELGDAPDLIQESGAQPDLIQEQGV